MNYRILLITTAAVIAASAVYLVSGRDPAAGQSAAAGGWHAEGVSGNILGTRPAQSGA